MSPDGKKLLILGDLPRVKLYSIGGGLEFALQDELESAGEAAFSAAWNDSSTVFAVATQDGFLTAWDVRKTAQKLASVPPSQRIPKGAGRVVKFTRSNAMDLLVMSEHVSAVSVVDARTFASRQVIRVAPAGVDANICGLAFSPDSQRLFVGLEQGVLEYRVNSAARRTFACASPV